MILLEIKDLNNHNGVLGTFTAEPTQRHGWKSVMHRGKMYCVSGGIRNNEFINLANPVDLTPYEVAFEGN